MKNKNLKIAIDGTSASGKDALGKLISNELGIPMISCGIYFRAVAYLLSLQTDKLESLKPKVINKILDDCEIIVTDYAASNDSAVFINGEELTEMLYTPEIGKTVALTSAFEPVYKYCSSRCREYADRDRIIVVGRNSGDDYLKNANRKYYLTATLECRARRRIKDFASLGDTVALDKEMNDLKSRDDLDQSRIYGPAKIPVDALIIDTTLLTLDDELKLILKDLKDINLL